MSRSDNRLWTVRSTRTTQSLLNSRRAKRHSTLSMNGEESEMPQGFEFASPTPRRPSREGGRRGRGKPTRESRRALVCPDRRAVFFGIPPGSVVDFAPVDDLQVTRSCCARDDSIGDLDRVTSRSGVRESSGTPSCESRPCPSPRRTADTFRSDANTGARTRRGARAWAARGAVRCRR